MLIVSAVYLPLLTTYGDVTCREVVRRAFCGSTTIALMSALHAHQYSPSIVPQLHGDAD